MMKASTIVLALALCPALPAFAEQPYAHEYLNGGHWGTPDRTETGAADNLATQILAGNDPSIDLPATASGHAPATHLYRNGGHFGTAQSDASLESTDP